MSRKPAGTEREIRLRFAVRLTPKGGRDAIEGWVEEGAGKRHLKVRVAAPPQDGMANDALLRLLAKGLGCPASKVRIVSGAMARMKIVEAMGDPELLPARLEALGSRP